jgi:hypothetical protein
MLGVGQERREKTQMKQTVEQRLVRLEKSNHRYRVALMCMGLLAVCVLGIAAKAPLAELLEARQIKTEQIAIVGPDGKTYAQFGIVEKELALVLYDTNAKPRLVMGTDPSPRVGEIGLKILNAEGKEVFFTGQRMDGRCETSVARPARAE